MVNLGVEFDINMMYIGWVGRIKEGNMNGIMRSIIVVSGVLGWVYWEFGWIFEELNKVINVLNKVNGGY